MMNNKKSLIALCIEVTNRTLGNRLKIIPADSTFSGINLEYGLNSYFFKIEVIKNISSNIQIQSLKSKLDSHDTIIFSNQISPLLHDFMVENSLNYIDLAGNMFIERDNILININGKKNINSANLQAKNRLVFYSSSLMIIFYLLQNKEFCQNTYRYISSVTEVSLGTIVKTIENLQLLDILNDAKELIQPKKLLELWVVNYAQNMRHKLVIGKYSLTKKFNNNEIMNRLGDLPQTFIGGEVSAELIDNYFQSKVLSIYTKDNVLDIIKRLYLKPDSNGEIEILEMFWNKDELKKAQFNKDDYFNNKLVPFVLIYTDLINSNNSRAATEANRLRDKYDIL